jgi:hypothetical protein
MSPRCIPLYSHSLDAVELRVPVLTSYSSQLSLYSRGTDHTENIASVVETPSFEFTRDRYTASALARSPLRSSGSVLSACLLERICGAIAE